MKKLICIILIFVMAASLFTLSASAAGVISWNFEDGTLTISGKGEMPDYTTNVTPWIDRKLKVKAAIVEQGVTYIGSQTFQNCVDMESVSIASSVEDIGDAAFYWCKKLKSVELPSRLEDISEQLFDHCSALVSIVIPEGVEEIGEAAFNCCSSLQSIYIPDSVEEIEYSAFNACKSLTDVYFGGSQRQWSDIEISTDNDPLGKASIHLNASPSSVPKAPISVGGADEESTTTDGSSSKTVKSSRNSVEWSLDKKGNMTVSVKGSMGEYNGQTPAWANDRKKIKTVTLENGVTRIGMQCFQYCPNLKSISVPSSVTGVGDYAFYECGSLKSVDLPDKCGSIGFQTYFNCKSLEYFDVPQDAEFIGQDAFSGCSAMEYVTIPASVTLIDIGAFNGCSNLRNVYYSGTTAQWNEIEIKAYNKPLLSASIHTSDSNPNANGGILLG